jgi:hypothetical protein
MTASAPEIWFRAVGTALAGASVLFAGYMVAFGDGKVRVNGMDHLAIFAQPRGEQPSDVAAIARSPNGAPLDETRVSSVRRVDEAAPAPQPARIVAVRGDRVWLMIGGSIRSAAPRDEVPGVGRIGAIVQREGGWAVVDDKGTTLLTVAKEANGAPLFSHHLIVE